MTGPLKPRGATADLPPLLRYEIEGPDGLRASEEWLVAGLALAIGAGIVGPGAAALVASAGGPPEIAATLLALAAAGAAAGGAIAVRRRELRVSPSGARLRTRSLAGTREVAAPGARVARVRVSSAALESGTRNKALFPIELVLRDAALLPPTFPLRRSTSEAAARAEAEALSRRLGVAFEDALGDEPILRSPDELDAAAPRSKPPASPPPRAIQVVRGAAGEEVRTRGLVPRRRLTVVVGIAVLAAAGTAGVLGVAGSRIEGDAPWIALLGGLAIWALLALVLAGLVAVRERVWVADGRVWHEVSLLGVPLSRAAVDAAAIEYLRPQALRAGGVGLVTDRGTRSVGRSLDGPEAAWLQRWIGSRL